MMGSRIIGLALVLIGVWYTCAMTTSSIQAQTQPGYTGPPSSGAGYASAATTADSKPQIPLYATRQSVFAIPFTVDRRVSQPVEVHLYVSVNQGGTWQLYSRQPPNIQQFTFRAHGDGEYWFASRTLDAVQPPQRQDSPQPELRVVVDTVSPQIEFTARPGEGGEVITSWQTYDQNLLASSLKLEYQEGVDAPWKPVAVQRPDDEVVRTSYQGQMTWYPQTRSPTINIRAEVRDRAGNLAVANRRLLLPTLVTQSPSSSGPMSRPADPFARHRQQSEGAIPWPSDNQPHDRSWTGNLTGNNGSQYPSRDAAPQANLAARGFPPSTTIPLRPDDASRPTAREGVAAQPTAARAGSLAGGAALNAESGISHDVPADTASAFPVSGSASPFTAPAPVNAPDAAGLLPPGERPQMTSSTQFRLEYDVDAVGPSGVAEVQLWATADGGHTWRLWGTDEDLQSPFDVIVEEEGIFGFHVVVVGRNGMSGRRPRTGDLADIWVGVDTTPPTAELTAATYGEGANSGKLLISWKAADRYLDPRPVTLSFSESVDGPWTVIASALPNSGSFAWKADPQLPPSVYVKLEVRDEAGNLAVDQTSDPVHIDGLAPKARIRSVQPVEGLDREAFRLPRRG